MAAADPDASNLAIFLERFPVTGYADYHEMLAQEEIDIAAPILPAGQSQPEGRHRLRRRRGPSDLLRKAHGGQSGRIGCHVEECASRGIAFASGDAYRNKPQHWKVKRLIDAGEIGEVQRINLYQSTNEISGGGCQGLSVLRLFADDADVDWVTGWCQGDPTDDGDQNMGGYVKFANGVDAFIHNKRTPLEGIEVLCSEGVYHSSWHSGHLWRDQAHKKLVEEEGFFDEFGNTEDWINPSGTRQRGGIQSIVESLDQGIEPRCSGDNMRKVLEIAIGLRESHRHGFAAVKFPIKDRSLKLFPHASRFLNKKETLGEEKYAEQITSSASRPIGGAAVV